MAIKLNNRQDLRLLRTEMETALSQVADRHTVQFRVGSIRYEGDGTQAKIQVEVFSMENGSPVTPELRDLRIMAQTWDGVEPEDLDRPLELAGSTCRLTGYRARAKKYPVLAKRCTDGKTFAFPATTVQAAILFAKKRSA
jgi:hypothetical protein